MKEILTYNVYWVYISNMYIKQHFMYLIITKIYVKMYIPK
jgi:hypothetical protein